MFTIYEWVPKVSKNNSDLSLNIQKKGNFKQYGDSFYFPDETLNIEKRCFQLNAFYMDGTFEENVFQGCGGNFIKPSLNGKEFKDEIKKIAQQSSSDFDSFFCFSCSSFYNNTAGGLGLFFFFMTLAFLGLKANHSFRIKS